MYLFYSLLLFQPVILYSPYKLSAWGSASEDFVMLQTSHGKHVKIFCCLMCHDVIHVYTINVKRLRFPWEYSGQGLCQQTMYKYIIFNLISGFHQNIQRWGMKWLWRGHAHGISCKTWAIISTIVQGIPCVSMKCSTLVLWAESSVTVCVPMILRSINPTTHWIL